MYQAQVVSDNILRKYDMGILRRGFVFEQNEYIPFVQFLFLSLKCPVCPVFRKKGFLQHVQSNNVLLNVIFERKEIDIVSDLT